MPIRREKEATGWTIFQSKERGSKKKLRADLGGEEQSYRLYNL